MASRPSTLIAASLLPRSVEFEQECVRFFEEVVQVFGVPKSVGQIYGLLYASAKPLSFSDIVERLRISKGSASDGLRCLRTLGAINVVDLRAKAVADKKAGHVRDAASEASNGRVESFPTAAHREYYVPELSLRKLVAAVISGRIAPLAGGAADRLQRLRELAEASGSERTFLLGRAKQLEIWRRKLKTVLPILGAVLGPSK